MEPKSFTAPSIRKALILTVLLSVIPSVFMMVYTSVESSMYQRGIIQAEALRQVEAISYIQTATTERIISLLNRVSLYGEFAGGTPEAQTGLLETLLDYNPDIENIAFSDTKGFVLASPGLSSGTDLSDRLHIQAALASGSCSAGEYVLARGSGVPSLPFAHPAYTKDGEIAGVFSLVYRLSEFEKLFEAIKFPDETILGLVDAKGVRLFFRPAKSTNPVGEKVKEDVWEGIVSGGESGTVTKMGSDGINRFYAFRRLTLPDSVEPYMYVVVGYPENLAYMEIRNSLTRNLIMIGVLLFVAAFIAVSFGNAFFGKRFSTLIQTADMIRGGDLSARTAIPNDNSDIAKVAAALDNMARQLELNNVRREKEETLLKESLDQKSVLLKEIHHRVKNNLQLILSMVHLHCDTEVSTADFARKIALKINAIATVHELLYEEKGSSFIALDEYFPRLISMSSEFGSCAGYHINAGGIALDLKSAIPLALIANELIMNSLKYAGAFTRDLHIGIDVGREEGNIRFVFADNGPGLGRQEDTGHTGGLGHTLIQALTQQLNGVIEFHSNEGLRVTIVFPENAAREIIPQ
ncbi:MAG: hypothetical protein JXB03_02970 [Spirochaetales bacterium]|nr:hypothetical protein [Spirochaetales bacterium]